MLVKKRNFSQRQLEILSLFFNCDPTVIGNNGFEIIEVGHRYGKPARKYSKKSIWKGKKLMFNQRNATILRR